MYIDRYNQKISTIFLQENFKIRKFAQVISFFYVSFGIDQPNDFATISVVSLFFPVVFYNQLNIKI